MISFLKSHDTKFLLFFTVFCAAVLGVRLLSGVVGASFSFLLFNLLLAWVPYLLSQVFILKNSPQWLVMVCLGIWLLFFPNSLYVFTDLFQLWPRPLGSFWFDLIMILSFALLSFLLGIRSLKNVESYFETKIKSSLKLQSLMFFFLYLGSFGVYLGRFRRWNSWDVLFKWAYLKKEGIYFFENPFHDIDFYGTTFVYAVFCYILYYGIFNFAKDYK
jgi:uncharacterized membrane protein